MMKFLLIVTLIFSSVYADEYAIFFKNFHSKNFKKACRTGKHLIYADEKDEKLLSLIAQSCLKVDYIYALSMVQHRLRKSKQTRADASAFASVVLQKKLLYQFMYDNTDISTLALPIVDHPLSYAFVAIRDGNYKVISKKPKVISFQKNNSTYKLYIDKKDVGRVVMEITDSNKKIRKRKYY